MHLGGRGGGWAGMTLGHLTLRQEHSEEPVNGPLGQQSLSREQEEEFSLFPKSYSQNKVSTEAGLY